MTAVFFVMRFDIAPIVIWIFELPLDRGPKANGAIPPKGVVGVIEGSKSHPPQLADTPPVLISLVPRHGLSISSSSSRARSGGACLLDIALTLRFSPAKR